MDLSIVIVNYRGWDDLVSCLDSLAPLLEGEIEVEVIVVDNDSGDGRLGAFSAKYPWALFESSGCNGGFAYGCNVGAERAVGRQLLFLNPDVADPGGQIASFLRLKEERAEAAILGVCLRDQRGQVQKNFDRFPSPLRALALGRTLLRLLAPHRNPDPRRARAELLEVDWVTGAGLMIAHQAWRSLGGWCEDFWMYSEDVDLCRRAKDAGLLTGYTTSVSLVHRHGGASRSSVELNVLTKAEVVISRHLYAHRHLRGWRHHLYQLLIFATRYLPLIPFALMAAVVRGRASRSVGIRAAMFGELTRHYRRILKDGNWISPRSVNFHS